MDLSNIKTVMVRTWLFWVCGMHMALLTW